jgi:hypothetical protein
MPIKSIVTVTTDNIGNKCSENVIFVVDYSGIKIEIVMKANTVKINQWTELMHGMPISIRIGHVAISSNGMVIVFVIAMEAGSIQVKIPIDECVLAIEHIKCELEILQFMNVI